MTEVPAREEVLHMIGRVCGRKFQCMHDRLDTLGLYHGQPSTLNALWEREGMTQSELADTLNRSPSTITKMVQRMEKAGFVERRDDAEDERISRVYLTDSGRNVRTAVEEIWHNFASQAFVNFSEQELVQFYALLQRFHLNIEE
ncbi:MAG: MarR family transcriptional regulator [Anaerolineae bacterium]|nr:MarR family transcriptional regulator [Anaerolineae bacterium]